MFSVGCYNSANKTIYLNKNLAGKTILFQFVLWHELGHWLLENANCKKMMDLWKQDNCYEAEEKAATDFWTLRYFPFLVSIEKKLFYLNLLKN